MHMDRDRWIALLSERNPHILEQETLDTIQNKIDISRAKETAEKQVSHFVELTELLNLCKHKHHDLLMDINIALEIKDSSVCIAPTTHTQASAQSRIEDGTHAELEKIIARITELLAPWRKGPFTIFGTHIRSEWDSILKWNRICEIYSMQELCQNKMILDIGCNNLYYSFLMMEHAPKLVLAIDPMPRYSLAADFFRTLLPSQDLFFEQWGVEDCDVLPNCFDTIFCMGILYHQRNPLMMLETIKKSLRKNGRLVLETICINNREPYCLVPTDRYQKAKGYWFIPSVLVLESWLQKSGFDVLAMDSPAKTQLDEQSGSSWIRGESLEDFLDKDDDAFTVEGYPAPYRICVVARLRH